MAGRSDPSPELRRRRLLRRFEALVDVEKDRLGGSPERDLRRLLVERFLRRHLAAVRGRVLEIGPGTGRFTPFLGGRGRKLVLLDLSPAMLRAARDRGRKLPPARRPRAYLRGAAEGLRMLRPRSMDAVVLLGTFGFFGRDVAPVLDGVRRALRPGGLLVLEAVSPTGATTEVFPPRPDLAVRILHAPRTHYLWRVLREGYQPYDPAHLANWEFGFWRPSILLPHLERHGFRVVERMSVAPITGNQPRLVRHLRRDPRAWRTLLQLEEEAGHFDEMLGGGPVWLIAAHTVRTKKLRPSQRPASGQ